MHLVLDKKDQKDKKIFLCFKDTDDAFVFYNHIQVGNNYYLYYPEIDNQGVVPGFASESDRYRKEAVLNLQIKNHNIFALEQKNPFF